MDKVDKLIEMIKEDADVKTIYFSDSFLTEISEVCIRQGYAVAWLFIMGGKKRKKRKKQIKALLKVLHYLRELKVGEEVGALIFRTLNSIKLVEKVGEDG